MNIKIRLALSFLLFVAGLLGFYFLSAQPTVVRLLVLLILAGLAIGVFLFIFEGQETFGFINSAITEAKTVVWPTRRETLQMTSIVIVLVVIMAIFLGLVDTGFSYIINMLLGRAN